MVDRNSAPIGVFDSGLGGLTVARAIMAALPSEDIVYLGDTARVPYGTRSAKTVMRYARACARQLQTHDIKLLVIACNTVSAVAVDMLRVELDVPVLGVIVPGARAGVEASRTHRIGVIATRGTVKSGAYVRAVAGQSSKAELVSQAAPLLVPLAEEGWVSGAVPREVIARYVSTFRTSGTPIDALILGCTHYPLLRDEISDVVRHEVGSDVVVVDSAEATAADLTALLDTRDLRHPRSAEGGIGGLRVLVTDLPDRFAEVAGRFLGRSTDGLEVEQVDL